MIYTIIDSAFRRPCAVIEVPSIGYTAMSACGPRPVPTCLQQAVAAVPGAHLDLLPISALTMQQGVRAGKDILGLAEPPDAVFAANDLVALGVLQGVALNGGLRVPDDKALVGYDDIEFASAAAVPITSVRQPGYRWVAKR